MSDTRKTINVTQAGELIKCVDYFNKVSNNKTHNFNAHFTGNAGRVSAFNGICEDKTLAEFQGAFQLA